MLDRLFLIGAILLLPQPTPAFELRFPKDVHLTGDSQAAFRLVDRMDPLRPLDPGAQLAMSATDDSRYGIALVNVGRLGANRFYTYEFRVARMSGGPEITHFLYNVAPAGAFSDLLKDIEFTVVDGSSSSKGTIRIPVHPLDPAAVCRVDSAGGQPLPTVTAPLPVFLGGETEYSVMLNCSAAPRPPALIRLEDPAATRPYWIRKSHQSPYFKDGKPQPIPVKSFTVVKATLAPKALSAVESRLRRFSASGSLDDTITIDLAYSIPPAGPETPLQIAIPVSLFPSLPVTLGALWLGALLGWSTSWVLTLAVGRAKSAPTAMRALLLSALLSVIAYAIALMAYGAKCRLELFGIDINPFDILILLLIGLACGFVALLRAEELLASVNGLFKKILKPAAATGSLLLLGFSAQTTLSGAHGLLGLSACPGGGVLGLNGNGAVIYFDANTPGASRTVGRIQKGYEPGKIACASVDDRQTAFIVASSADRIFLFRMDVGTGRWGSPAMVGRGTSGGVAYDPRSRSVYIAAAKERAIYRVPDTLRNASRWASIYGPSDSLGALLVNPATSDLVAGESFSGTLYSISTRDRRQARIAGDFGAVNSLSLDADRNRLYVADSGRRTIWVLPLASRSVQASRSFYRASHLNAVTGIAVDAAGNVWIGLNEQGVLILSPQGRQIGHIEP